MDHDVLLDRIRRLLRLAESANVNEAANAAAAAQALMARHRIEAASLDDDVDAGIEDQRDAPLDASKRLRPWKTELAAAVARANGCRIYLLEGDRVDQVILVGRREDADLVRIVHPELVKQIESLARKHGAGKDRDFCNGIRLGAVTTIGERLRLANAEATTRALAGGVEGMSGDGASVAVAVRRLGERDDAVDRFVERTLRLRPGKSRSLRADAEGYALGRVSANTIGLDAATRARRDD